MQTQTKKTTTFRLRFLAVVFLIALLISVLSGEAKAPPGNSCQVWSIVHDTSDFGKIHLWIGSEGVRVELERLHCAMVATPPEWKPILFNMLSKVRWETTLKKLEKTEIYPIVVDYSYRDNWKNAKVSYGKMRGIDAVCLSVPTNIKFHPVMASLSMEQKTFLVRQMRYYYSKSITLPKEALSVVTSMYHLPSTTGVPLALAYTYDNGQCAWGIVLLSAKQETVNKKLFVCPSGFKKVSDHLAVLGQENNRAIDDMVRDLGLGEDFGRKRK